MHANARTHSPQVMNFMATLEYQKVGAPGSNDFESMMELMSAGVEAPLILAWVEGLVAFNKLWHGIMDVVWAYMYVIRSR